MKFDQIERLALARRPLSPDVQRYETEKSRWISLHPEATHEQYQQAMTQIAKACGC